MENLDKEKNTLIKMPILIALSLVFGIVVGYISFKKDHNESEKVEIALRKIKEVVNLVDKEYVDTVDDAFLAETAIKALINKLDPHSIYISADDKQLSEIALESNYEGIGIEFNIIEDTLVVISAISGGPSEQIGILPGDKILKINNEKVSNISLTNQMVFDRLRGPKDSKVDLEVKRKGISSLLKFELIRDKIPSKSLEASYMIDDKTGYIKISRFTESTVDEFKETTLQLKESGMKRMILDLKNNTGGVLSSALLLTDELLDDGKLILYTESKVESSNFEYSSRIPGLFEKGQLIILINEGSASASEIVAGALQDHDRALIIGRRSFGKGLVQSSFDLIDGSELRMTISRYFIPSGRSIQKPYENGREDYSVELNTRFANGEYFHADSIKFPDSLMFRTASGRKVYGGGGIMPDIFVPGDTSDISDYLIELNGNRILYDYCFEYANDHRKKLESQSLDQFINAFEVNSNMMNEVINNAEKKGIEFNSNDFKRSESLIKLQIKALVSENIWGDTGFFKIHNSTDPIFRASLSLLSEELATHGSK